MFCGYSAVLCTVILSEEAVSLVRASFSKVSVLIVGSWFMFDFLRRIGVAC